MVQEEVSPSMKTARLPVSRCPPDTMMSAPPMETALACTGTTVEEIRSKETSLPCSCVSMGPPRGPPSAPVGVTWPTRAMTTTAIR
jgi:hypothetical protein